MTRVVIVDDDPLVRAGLRFILSSADDLDVVGEASDGVEAVRQARALVPDVILMDLRMPRMDGREATAEMMKLPRPPKVLALTTFDTDVHLMSLLDAGASGYLVKDTPPAELIDAVRQTAKGGTILSSRHARVLLHTYAEDGTHTRRRDAREALARLTEREQQVVHCVARGLTNAEIAERLHCAPATVKAHLAHIFAELHIPNRVHLAILGHDARSPEHAPGRLAASSPHLDETGGVEETPR